MLCLVVLAPRSQPDKWSRSKMRLNLTSPVADGLSVESPFVFVRVLAERGLVVISCCRYPELNSASRPSLMKRPLLQPSAAIFLTQFSKPAPLRAVCVRVCVCVKLHCVWLCMCTPVDVRGGWCSGVLFFFLPTSSLMGKRLILGNV